LEEHKIPEFTMKSMKDMKGRAAAASFTIVIMFLMV